MFLKTDDPDIFVDSETLQVVQKSLLEEQITKAQARLSEIPAGPTDEELLAWARTNYPQMDYSVEKANLEKIVSDNTARLEAMI